MKCHWGHTFGTKELLIIRCVLLPGWIHCLRAPDMTDIWLFTAHPSSFVRLTYSFTLSQSNRSKVPCSIFPVTSHAGSLVII